jgi:aminoglycoside phosphotransferase (APT) family kinase protein
MAGAQSARKDSWREPPPPRSVLVAAGLADQTASAAAHLEDVSRSHAVTRAVLPDGRSYVIKQLPSGAHAAGRSLKAELYTYRLASWREDLAALLPQCVHLDERRQLVVTQAAPAHHLYSARIGDPLFPQPEVGAALGRTLALLHSATADLPTVSVANCGVIALPDTPAEQRRLGDDSPSGKQAIARVCDDDDICGILRATVASFSPSCLIHGDVKWDNIVVDDGPPPNVLLFDWELSGRGDPAWDLGSALADTVTLPTRSLPTRSSPSTGQCADWVGETERAMLAAYGAAAPQAGSDFAGRVAGCWSARIAHLALECAAATENAWNPRVSALLDTAKMFAQQYESVADTIRSAMGQPT